jgi:hypothetical protein
MKEYLVSYYFHRGQETGFGSRLFEVKNKLSSNDLQEISKIIKESSGNDVIVILNIIKFPL